MTVSKPIPRGCESLFFGIFFGIFSSVFSSVFACEQSGECLDRQGYGLAISHRVRKTEALLIVGSGLRIHAFHRGHVTEASQGDSDIVPLTDLSPDVQTLL